MPATEKSPSRRRSRGTDAAAGFDTWTRSVCMARLGPSREEQAFIVYGERRRAAVDRNKRLTPRLLEMF